MCSSAEGIDSELYDRYKIAFNKMMLGDGKMLLIEDVEKQANFYRKEQKVYEYAMEFWEEIVPYIDSARLYIKDNILVVECDNSNPTLITDLRRSLKRKLPDNIEFDSERNDNGFYGKTYEFYIYDDLDESLTEGFSKGQDVYIKPNKRFGKIKSHIKNDLYEVETYDGKDKNLPDRIDTYYASDLELKESLPLSGVAKLKGKKTLRRRDEHDGCKCILGRNNTELSGDKDLHESIDDIYNDVMTPEEARKYWDSEKDSDPVLAEFDNFQDWYDESVKNGYIKESITESTEKFEIVPAGSGKWKVLKNSVDGGRVSEDSRIVIDADTKEEAREILLANGFKAEELLESIENVSIDTEDETMTMTTKEDGGVVIETSPKEEFEETFGEEEPTELENGDEMIAPLDPETEDELGITDESEEDDMNFDFGEETPESPEEDVDIEEFDEETFDGLGESYLRRCYENVNSFKTTNVICNENLLTVEGNIGFKSGNVKRTSFIFEAKESNNGKYVFEGYNNEINIGKKAFRLNCSIDNKKIIPESLKYNYRSKNDLNESVKLHGTVKAPKRG